MKNKLLTKFLLITLIINTLFIVNQHKVYADVFPYSEDIVKNIAAVMTHENGCGRREDFTYQLIWGATFINNYDLRVGINTPITLDTICRELTASYTSAYCRWYSDGGCNQAQVNQLRLATRMVLAKSFTIPKNIYISADINTLNAAGNTGWISYVPYGTTERWRMYFGHPNNQALATKDVYGNTVRTDEAFYHTLADCLYEHPTLYNAHNNCSGSSGGVDPPTPTKYYVYLYPNGGTGISEGQKFEYTGTTEFSKFPKVTKTNCTLDGWNVGSPTGTQYYKDVDATDNGKKLYARWVCQSETNTGKTHTVTYKLNDGTDKVYKTEQVSDGGRVNFPVSPKRDGYNFYGWVDEAGNLFYYANPIKADTIIYAQWVVKQTKSTSSNTENANNTNKQQTNSTTKVTQTPNDDKEEINNPQTGSAITVITLLLIVLSLVGISYYNKYYKIAENDI